MPRLGEAVEPSRAEAVTPWWRAANTPVERTVKVSDEPPQEVELGEPID
jgi:hypothetical protein